MPAARKRVAKIFPEVRHGRRPGKKVGAGALGGEAARLGRPELSRAPFEKAKAFLGKAA